MYQRISRSPLSNCYSLFFCVTILTIWQTIPVQSSSGPSQLVGSHPLGLRRTDAVLVTIHTKATLITRLIVWSVTCLSVLLVSLPLLCHQNINKTSKMSIDFTLLSRKDATAVLFYCLLTLNGDWLFQVVTVLNVFESLYFRSKCFMPKLLLNYCYRCFSFTLQEYNKFRSLVNSL